MTTGPAGPDHTRRRAAVTATLFFAHASNARTARSTREARNFHAHALHAASDFGCTGWDSAADQTPHRQILCASYGPAFLAGPEVTHVAGSPVPLYLAGARLLELFPMMPVMGNLTLVVGVLSYAGQLNLTRSRRPRPLPGPGDIHQRRAHGPRRPRTIGARASPLKTGLTMGFSKARESNLSYEEKGEGLPIPLTHRAVFRERAYRRWRRQTSTLARAVRAGRARGREEALFPTGTGITVEAGHDPQAAALMEALSRG
jgi:WS/DGAT C-terminal domain